MTTTVRQFVQVELEDGVATVTYDRPPVNAVESESSRQIKETFEELSRNRDVRVAIFTAAGNRAFIAGADLKARAERDTSKDQHDPIYGLDPGRGGREAFFSLYDCSVPVIGAINGPAIGAGLAYVAMCDIIIASENARFATTEINVGLLGAGSFLQRMAGPYKMRKLFYTGEFATAEEMYRLGAVEAVVPNDDLLPTAKALARRIAEKSPIAIRLAKESLNRMEYLPIKDAYRTEQDYTNRLRTFEDSREATIAFNEKRAPVWKWR
jgi:enoyl-CoA hydratase